MAADANLEQRNLAMGVLALGLALYPASHLISAALGDPTALAVAQAVIRYGLVAAIGLLARPLALKVSVAVASLVFLTIDVLAITGLFSLYSVLRPEPDPFIYFQF